MIVVRDASRSNHRQESFNRDRTSLYILNQHSQLQISHDYPTWTSDQQADSGLAETT
ncbi:hypothetical protein [Coleofasciculus sp. E2-BRE-01]|uniref:hypothetical protein n=1 Tax=Coleofasciculus sp. E2-BRE-01 TaxID=3069524 RepID=UPI0032F9AFBD